MSRRLKTGVRGPNSALTEFLKIEGITDAFRERQTREESLSNATPEIDEDEDVIVVPPRRRRVMDDEERELREAAKKKRKAARRAERNGDPGDSGSESSFGPSDDYSDSSEDGDGYKKFGEEESCAECSNPFTLTVYSRFVEDLKGYLCEDCNEGLKKKERAARRNELNARKRRKKLAQALLDKRKVRIPSLQDICIKVITLNIGDVEVLGDIGQMNINKISRILSKNRSLNDSTVSLFLSPDVKELELWDCSNVNSHSLNQIASYCSKLESLTLFMCGQFHNDNLEYYKDKLPELRKLSLNGPFLISNSMWQEYFKGADCKLTSFEVRNTHRFDGDSLLTLLENRGQSLTRLLLSRLDGLDSVESYNMIPHYLSPIVTHLEISYPCNPDLVTDDLLIHILAITGETLTYLNVDGCSSLTDTFLTEGIAKFCPSLESLSMRNLDKLTDDGFVEAMKEYSVINSGGFVTVDLTKCTGLGDSAVYALLRHSGHTLVELSLNSLDNISTPFLTQIFTEDTDSTKVSLKQSIEDGLNDGAEESEVQHYYEKTPLPLLTRWDVGFVRSFNDEVAHKVSESCSKLAILEVYGDNKCTSKALVRPDILVIGRQSDMA